METFSVFDPSVSFKSMFLWAVEEGNQIDTNSSAPNSFRVNYTPNYDKAIKAYIQFNTISQDETDYHLISLIENSYDFIWQGLEKEIQTSDLLSLRRFATKLLSLKEIRDRYESGIRYLLAAHIRKVEQTPIDERGSLSKYANGTIYLQAKTGVEGAIFLIDSATQMVNQQLQDNNQNNEQTDATGSDMPDGRSEDTKRKARQAVTLYEKQIEDIIQREKGKFTPMQNKNIINEAIQKYLQLAVGQNLGSTQKSLDRYLKDIGKNQTAIKYGRQFVGQLRGFK